MSWNSEQRLIERIYAAALDPGGWPDVLAGIADHVGGTQAALTRLDMTDASGEAIQVRGDPIWLDRYHAHFQSRNVFTLVDDVSDKLRSWRRLDVRTDADCLDWEVYQGTEYCNDFMRPQGVNAALFIRLEMTGALGSAVNVGRAIGQGRFQKEHLETAARLQPHLIRAYGMARALSGSFGLHRDVALSLDSSSHAIFLVDEAGKIRLTNRPGERLLGEGRGLTVHNGHLTAERAETARRLQQLVAAATDRAGSLEGGALSVTSPGHRFPLALRVTPVGGESLPIFCGPRSALICVTDLEVSVRPPERELRALFGLTVAEARVAAAIFDGLSVKEVAEAFEVSINTVRFQLARIYEKTGAPRQAELVKMMMRLAAGL